jgi:hypothetical protein
MPQPKIENLIRLSTFAKLKKCTVANIYKYIDKYAVVVIDGVKFIDKTAPYNVEGKRRGNG